MAGKEKKDQPLMYDGIVLPGFADPNEYPDHEFERKYNHYCDMCKEGPPKSRKKPVERRLFAEVHRAVYLPYDEYMDKWRNAHQGFGAERESTIEREAMILLKERAIKQFPEMDNFFN